MFWSFYLDSIESGVPPSTIVACVPIRLVAMNISGATQAALQGVADIESAGQARAGLQVALLKKALQSQEDQAAELLKMMSGKGQSIDLRV